LRRTRTSDSDRVSQEQLEILVSMQICVLVRWGFAGHPFHRRATARNPLECLQILRLGLLDHLER
jgi:hypothetical protein